ncbi:CLC_0170 family protein [Alicyclobacillus ferrooxydans]|uniref:Uncharacterized protein n=1 Tax=Alicyclobacillus ferrooxydans TaxID=471514 RepID=A0A0P9CD90_9BACL|nr:CLC_0170 family protein [Alicyclobacillus ferrooxydans]KPV43704.1 hypothetical protein AN477_11125 [Alicyclobacillus ferrooxydans]
MHGENNVAYLDFTQIYPTVTAGMLILTGLYAFLVDRREYQRDSLFREARWARTIGITWIITGCGLFLAGWVWRNFIW